MSAHLGHSPFFSGKFSGFSWVVLALLPAVALGAPKSWDRGAGTDNWGDGDNWNPNGVPAVNDPITIDHAWQGVAAPFTVDLGGVNRDLGSGVAAALTITGQDATIRPTIQNGAILTNDAAVLNITHATITAAIRGMAVNNVIGNTTLTNVNYSSTSNGWENRGKTWNFTDSAINIGTSNALTVKANVAGALQGVATLNNTSLTASFFILGEFATSDAVIATLNLTNGSTFTALGSLSSVGQFSSPNERFGWLNITDSTAIVRSLTIRANGKLTTSNAVIDLRAASSPTEITFGNALTDGMRFDGDGLTVRVGSSGVNRVTRYEVAGQDVGRLATIGYSNTNFWITELVLGLNPSQIFLLLDNNDNQLNGPANEALYVDTLRILGDTTIDLNGLGLYYRNLVNTGNHTITQLNGQIIQVPEPTAAVVVGFAMVGMLRRRGGGA